MKEQDLKCNKLTIDVKVKEIQSL